MGRKVAFGAALVVLALALAGPATATGATWSKFATGLSNIIQPSAIRTQAGSELIAWNSPDNVLHISRNGQVQTFLNGYPDVGKPALVQQPNGALQLYVPAQNQSATLDGVLRMTSTDDGATWTGPVQTNAHNLADVGSAAVAPNGTPYFTQSGTGFVNVYSGLNGTSVKNVFTDCCGYAESVAVDSASVVRVAFWSNATSEPNRFLVDTLGSGLTAFGTQTIPRDDRVPLVSYGTHTYLLWSDGYPSATSVILQRISGGSVTLDKGSFTGGDPHMALALEPDGKLWALWTKGGVVRAARSRTNGVSFGAKVTLADPTGATAYQLEAVAQPGSVEALLNTGDSLWQARLLPGITVHATRKVATVLDDGFPIKGATLKGGGKTLHTNAKGHATIAKLAKGTRVSVTAKGYTPTRFRVP